MEEEYWKDSCELKSKSYTCGYCGEKVCSNEGYFLTNDYYGGGGVPTGQGFIYICHNCNKPTYITYDEQVPQSAFGISFSKEIFPDEKTYLLYNEIRNCYKASAYSSCVLSARKLLMHIAVDCEAEENKDFKYYVDYLDDNNYIPKNCKEWVNIIRLKGNEATHHIEIFNEKDAKQIINFLEILINVVYAMKYQADNYIGKE